MDKRSGQYQTYIESSEYYEHSYLHWYNNWYCYINNRYVTSNLDFHIKDVRYIQKMKDHICQCKYNSEKVLECIDWYAIGKASKNLTLQRQIWVTKYVSVFFAYGNRMHK